MSDDDFSMGDDDLIWHYTSTQGLLGILDERAASHRQKRMGRTGELARGAFSLRFTDAQYLNDPQEMLFGREVLADILNAQAHELDGDDRDELEDGLRWLTNPDEDLSSRNRDIATRGTYVACFSTARDSLSQWNGYAGSRGYAVAFDRSVLAEMWAPLVLKDGATPASEMLVQPLPYDMNYGLDAATEWFNGIAPNIIHPIVQTPRRYLCQLALAYAKDTPYQHEEEVRAVVLRGPTQQELEFREGRLGVVPYVTVSYLPDDHGARPLIREIMVGPGDEIEPRLDVVMQLVHARGFDPETEIPVTKSKVLFRM